MASASSAFSSLARPGDLGGHRSFTLPARLSDAKPLPSATKPPEADIETLFESPKCKIVSFSPAIPSTRFRTVSLDAANLSPQPVGELPCGSNTERTIALGPLRVYRVPGSVAFLNSGKLVHAVLPKSACWCIDGKTNFVLGVPGKKYYRIELPCEDEKDQAKADDFKIVLAKISQYETTACPFKRDFHVALPELNPAKTKRPWKPKHAPGVISPWSPEGQHLADGVQPERLFPSPSGTQDHSPRRRYVSLDGDVESSGSESIPDSGSERAVVSMQPTYKVPQLVATFDELGPDIGPESVLEAAQLPEKLTRDDLDVPIHALDQQHSVGDSEDAELEVPYKPSSDIPQTIENTVEERLPVPTHDSDVHTLLQDNHQLNPDSVSKTEMDTDSYGLQTDGGGDTLAQPITYNVGTGTVSQQLSESVNPLGIITPPRLQMESRIDNANWLGVEESEETPTATKSLSDMHTHPAPIYGSLSPDVATEIDSEHAQRQRHNSEAQSLASVESSSSFHSFHSPTSPVLSSPIFETEALDTTITESLKASGSPNLHKRETSSNTIRANNLDTQQDDLSTPTWPRFISPDEGNGTDDDLETGTESDSKSYITATSPVSPQSPSPSPPPEQTERRPRSEDPSSSLRVRLRRRRTHSPMPSAANLYIPPSGLSGHLTSMILNKTANLLLGPPVQLVALMLNLARRFADGKLKGETYTYGDKGQPIPCEWCDSDLDYEGNSSEEDDYGISIGGTPEKRKRKTNGLRGRMKTDSQGALD